MEIIDAQMEILFPEESLSSEVTPWATLAARLEVLSEAGIGRAVCFRTTDGRAMDAEALRAINRRVVKTCDGFPGRLIPAAAVHSVLTGPEARALICFCSGELGLRVAGVAPADEPEDEAEKHLYWDAIEQLTDHRMISVLHCGADTAEKLADRYPEGRFIIGGGLAGLERKLEVMASRPNLHLLISGYRIASSGLIRDAAGSLGASRLVFGCGLGRVDPVVAVACVRRSCLEEDEQRLVLAGTLEQLLLWTEQ